MLGKSDSQLDFEDSTGWRERIPQRSFWWKFRELEEESAFDDRVKLALGMRRGEAGIDAATLCRHRQKLFSSGKAEELLAKVVGLGRAEGVISENAALVVDSFLANGACARQDTVTLIRRAALRVLKTAEFHGVDLGVNLQRNDYEAKKKPAIDWRDPAERARLVESSAPLTRMEGGSGSTDMRVCCRRPGNGRIRTISRSCIGKGVAWRGQSATCRGTVAGQVDT